MSLSLPCAAGGKDKSNREYLKNLQENLLYKEFGVRANVKQSLSIGEIDLSSFRLISLQGYCPKYDENYLNGLIAKATKSWAGVDVESFISE